MFHVTEATERFFRTFESNAASDDVALSVSQFADTFMAAGPQGTQAVKAADFAQALPRRKQWFASLGHRSTELVGLRETRLDARFVMATTHWKMTFVAPGSEPRDVLVDSVYIVDNGVAGDDPRIVFYLANQDLVQVLKERGIIDA